MESDQVNTKMTEEINDIDDNMKPINQCYTVVEGHKLQKDEFF